MKVRLVAYREKLTDSGVVVNNPGSTYAVTSSETTITVDGNDATAYFVANQTLVNTSGEIYGVVKTVPNATSITLQSVQTEIPDNAILYYYPETQFELDLSEEPSIVVNFNFLELGEPMKRMGSFSQTIKLPFTEDNNKFFQNYFDVNIETMQFDANVKVSSIVYVDSIEQLKGFLQLKAIYLNARQYEVVIFGNSSNFFTAIKDKKIKDNYYQTFYSSKNFLNKCIKKLKTLSQEYKCIFEGEITLKKLTHFGRDEIQKWEIGDNLIYYKEQNKPSSCVIVGFLYYKNKYCDFENRYLPIVFDDTGINYLSKGKLLHGEKQRKRIKMIKSNTRNLMNEFINIASKAYFKTGYNEEWIFKNYTARKLITKFRKELLVKNQTPSFFKC